MLDINKYNNDFNKQTCPSCGSILPKSPKRKCLCPFCSEPIFYRKEPESGMNLLLDQNDIRLFELYKKSYFSLSCSDSGKYSKIMNMPAQIFPYSIKHVKYCMEHELDASIEYIFPLLNKSLKACLKKGIWEFTVPYYTI